MQICNNKNSSIGFVYYKTSIKINILSEVPIQKYAFAQIRVLFIKLQISFDISYVNMHLSVIILYFINNSIIRKHIIIFLFIIT